MECIHFHLSYLSVKERKWREGNENWKHGKVIFFLKFINFLGILGTHIFVLFPDFLNNILILASKLQVS